MKSLEERVQRMEDVHEIQNLMGRLEFLHTAGLEKEAMQLFALKTPGVSAEVANWGVYEGPEGIRKMSLGIHLDGEQKARPGTMHLHTLTTPVIEVAGDGKTAKAVWLSPGLETDGKDSKFQAMWAWVKYGIDFVKEEGKWKIWHSHAYAIFMTPYEKSWVEAPPHTSTPMVVPDEIKPDRPSTYLWEYSTDRVYENVPAPPEPYETWDGKSVA